MQKEKKKTRKRSTEGDECAEFCAERVEKVCYKGFGVFRKT